MKKSFALILSVIMVWSIVFVFPLPTSFAVEGEETEKQIEYAFVPDELEQDLTKLMTRSEFCSVSINVYSFLMEKTRDTPSVIDLPKESPFTDTTNLSVLKAYSLGILPPIEGGQFRPDDPINLQEKATMLYKIMLLVDPKIDDKAPHDIDFADETQIAPWALTAIKYLTEKQIVAPNQNNEINPTDPISRGDSNEITADVVTHILELDGSYDSLKKELQYDFIPDELEQNGKTYISRAQFCEVISSFYEYFQKQENGKSLKPIVIPSDNPFADTDNAFVLKAYGLGVVTGDTSGNFRPNDKLTLQEKAIMLYKTMMLINPKIVDEDPIDIETSDAATIEQWAMKAIDYLVDNNILPVDTNNQINPTDPVRVSESNEMTAEAVDVLLSSLINSDYKYLLNGYHVINKGPITPGDISIRNKILDATKVTPYLATDSVYISEISDQVSNSVYKLYSSYNIGANVSYDSVLFSGSAKSDYSITSTLDKNDYVIKHSEMHPFSQVYLDCDTSVIKKDLLSDQFTTDVDNMTPRNLFDKYGTHLITRYVLGGRLELNYRFNNVSKMSETDIAAAVDASYKGYKGEISIDLKNKVDQLVTSSTLRFKSVGGQAITGSTVADLNSKYEQWADSIPDKKEICYVYDFNNSMVPLWELVKDSAKAKALQDEFDTYIPTATSMIKGLDYVEQPTMSNYVTDIVVSTDKNKDSALARIPAGYNIVCLNSRIMGVDDSVAYLEANHGAGGDFIYIGYKLGTNKNQAISDIKITEGSVKDYTHIPVDLNKGAGGKYIYINYSRSVNADKPITAISGYYAEHFTIPTGWESPSSNMDLNKGAGGDYIYLILRR